MKASITLTSPSSSLGRKLKGMVVFDMDGTLIEEKSSWWLIHKVMGTLELAEKYERMYREGKIDYDEWADLDISSWMGKDFSPAILALRKVKLMKGAKQAIELLRLNGFLVGVVSAGLNVVLKRVLDHVKLDFYEVNELILKNNVVIGYEIKVGYRDKGKKVVELSRRFSIPLNRVAVVGDSENDIEMFKLPEVFRIAFIPSHPELRRLADVVMLKKDLTKVAEVIIERFKDF